MPSFLDFLQGLDSYDPTLPPDVPKPPGYWARKQWDESGALSIPGILMGILGSGLQKLTEEVPERIMSAGQSRMPDVPLITPDWLKEYRRRLREGEDHTQAASAIPTIPRLAMTTLADPTTYLGGWVKNVPGVGGKVLQGVERGVNLPGETAIKGLGASVHGVARGADKLGLNWFKQAPASKAAQAAREVGDITSKSPGILKGIMRPIEDEGQYALPITAKGGVNLPYAINTVNKEYDELEKLIVSDDPLESTWKMALLQAMKSSTADLRDFLGGVLGKGTLDEHGIPDAEFELGAWQYWFDQTRRRQDTLREELSRPLPAPFSNRPQTPDEAIGLPHPQMGEINNLATSTREEWIKVIDQAKQDVNAVRGEVGKGSYTIEEGKGLTNAIYHERDKMLKSSQDQLLNTMRQVLGEEALGTDASKAFINRLEDFQKQVYDPTGGMGMLSDRERGVYDILKPFLEPEALKVVGDRSRLARLVVAGFKKDKPKSISSAWERMGNMLGEELPMWGEVDSKTLMSVLERAYEKAPHTIDPTAVNKVRTLLDKYHDVDILMSNPLDIALPKAQMKYEQALPGGRVPKQQVGAWDSLKKWFGISTREAAEGMIYTPGFVYMLNPISAIGAAGLHSASLIPQVSKSVGESLKVMKFGLKRPEPGDIGSLPSLVARFVASTGLRPPRGVDVGQYANANYFVTHQTRLAAEEIHPVARGLIGAITASGDPLTAGANAAFSVFVGSKSKYNPRRMMKHSMEAIESAARMTMWQMEATQELQRALPDFLDDMQKYLSTPRTRTTQAPYELTKAIVPGAPIEMPMGVWNKPEVLQDIVEKIRATDGLISRDAMQDILEEAGVVSDDVSHVLKGWTEIQDAASKAGERIANKYQVDYSNFTNIEAFVSKLIPFTRWPTHMAGVMTEAILGSPSTILFLNRLNSLTKEEAEELGLPPKYEDSIPGGKVGQAIASMLLRRDVTPMFDPSRGIPFAGYVPDNRETRYSQGPVEGAMDLMPLQPYPHVLLPLQAASAALSKVGPLQPLVMSPERPLPTLNRYSGFMNLLSNLMRGVPGVNEAVPRLGGAERGIQELVEALPGDAWRPYSYERAGIQKRIGEMGGEETGFVDHPQYKAAKGREQGDIFQRAKDEYLRTRGLEGGLSTLLPFTTRFAGDTEVSAATARRHLPTGPADTPAKVERLLQAQREAPEASLSGGVSGTQFDTRMAYVQAVKRDPAMLFPDADPSVAATLSKALAGFSSTGNKNRLIENPLIAVAYKRMQTFLSQYPEAEAYDYWRQNVHPERRGEGEDALMAQFKEWYLSGGSVPSGWNK